ncbi:MAG: type II secretion system secretin GspD [Pusillimonas sp.]|nr:type II secretion system secretin GspD [Pusillimonas sp.]
MKQSTVSPGPSPFVVRTTATASEGRATASPDAVSQSAPPGQFERANTMAHTGNPERDAQFRSSANDNGATTMLNFVEADINGVVRALAQFTGRNFVVDPRVNGQLTLVSEMPVNSQTAYEMLLAALRMRGFAVVDVNGVSRVVPEADAKLQGVRVADAAQGGGELATRVFQLRYESAANLVPVLRPMIAPDNTINAYPSNNTLVVTDYADNLVRIAEVIQRIDTPDSMSTDVLQIRHGVALDVAALANQLLNNRRGDGPAQILVVADPRSNAVLMRANNPEKLKLARDLIRRIDSPESGGGNLHVVYLRNAQATELARVLRGALEGRSGSGDGNRVQVSDANGLGQLMDEPIEQDGGALPVNSVGGAASMPGVAMLDSMQAGGSGLRTGRAQSVAFSAGGATIQADPSTNTLIIAAPPPLYRSLREVIDQLDQRRAQVLVESLIVEVNADDAAELGIQWMLGANDIENGGSSFFGGANLGGSGLNRTGPSSIDTLAQGLSLGVVRGTVNILGNQVLNLSVLARALQSNGNANVLSTPNLLTLDNEEASIMVGRTVPFVTGQYTTSGDGASNPFQTVSREDVGLTLRIRPQISEGGTVKLALYQEVSDIDAGASSALNGLVTRKRALETDVLVDDGQIIVLGGLLEDTLSTSTSSVPLLGDIPGIGQLFRYDSRTRTKTNLMVFLRPHIIRNAQDSASITLDRYNYMRAVRANLPDDASWLASDTDVAPLPAVDRNPGTGLLDLRGLNPEAATGMDPS